LIKQHSLERNIPATNWTSSDIHTFMSVIANSALRNLDVFGSKITLNYKSDMFFRTSFGGFVTIALISFLIVLFFKNVTPVINIFFEAVNYLHFFFVTKNKRSGYWFREVKFLFFFTGRNTTSIFKTRWSHIYSFCELQFCSACDGNWRLDFDDSY